MGKTKKCIFKEAKKRGISCVMFDEQKMFYDFPIENNFGEVKITNNTDWFKIKINYANL